MLASLKGSNKPQLSEQSRLVPKARDHLSSSSIRNIDNHQAKARSAGRKDPPKAAEVSQLTIDGIRALPGLAEIVENLVEEELSKVPSLARPLATGSRKVVIDSETDLEEEILYKRKPNGRFVKIEKRVPGNMSTARHGLGHKSVLRVESDPDSDDSQDDEAPAGYLYRYKRSYDGVKYRIKERQREDYSPKMIPQYVLDPVTGVELRKMMPVVGRRKSFTTPVHSSQTTRHDCRESDTPDGTVRRERKILQLGRGAKSADRYPAFLAPQQQEEKEGKDSSSKLPVLVQVARNCPVTWSKKVTTDKMNLALYCWATLSELLASRTGMSESLKRGELEARLQHTLHVLEIALQSSSQSDYDHTGWKVARLYHEKIQSKVDRGESSWLLFAQKHGTDSQTHELLAAERELATKPKGNVAAAGAGAGTGSREQYGEKKRKCGSWNFSTVRGKCQFEVDNPDARACNRLHECSYCSGKGFKQLNHQRTFCPKKQESGDN